MNRTWKVTGGAAAIALAAAACSSGSGGTGGSSAKDVKLVQAAYTTTTKAKTAKAQMQVRIAQGDAGTADISATGKVNLTSQQGEFDISLPQGLDEHAVYTHGIAYEKLPDQVRSRMHVNTPWVSIDMNKAVKAQTGSSLAQLQQQQPENPLDQLSYLRSVSSKITKDGTETVDGAKTTHYRAQIDLNRQKTEAAGRLAKVLGSHNLPVQVWIDEQGRLRKMQVEEKIHQPTTGASVTVSMQLRLSDFGTRVSVQPPAKDQTTDVTAVLSGGR